MLIVRSLPLYFFYFVRHRVLRRIGRRRDIPMICIFWPAMLHLLRTGMGSHGMPRLPSAEKSSSLSLQITGHGKHLQRPQPIASPKTARSNSKTHITSCYLLLHRHSEIAPRPWSSLLVPTKSARSAKRYMINIKTRRTRHLQHAGTARIATNPVQNLLWHDGVAYFFE